MKEYVLKIGFDPNTDEVVYIKEYIEGAKAVLHVDDEEIELDDDIATCLDSNVMGIAWKTTTSGEVDYIYEKL